MMQQATLLLPTLLNMAHFKHTSSYFLDVCLHLFKCFAIFVYLCFVISLILPFLDFRYFLS